MLSNNSKDTEIVNAFAEAKKKTGQSVDIPYVTPYFDITVKFYPRNSGYFEVFYYDTTKEFPLRQRLFSAAQDGSYIDIAVAESVIESSHWLHATLLDRILPAFFKFVYTYPALHSINRSTAF